MFVATAVVLALSCSGLLRPLQAFLEEQRFRVVTRPATGQLLLCDIDEPSIRAMGTWPWSRSVHAAIIDRLRALGAADIAFDVDFSSPSTPDGDKALEEALRRADGAVILAALQQVVGSGPVATAIESRPMPRLANQALEGSVNVWPDPDGAIRWFSRGERFGGITLPSLAAFLGAPSGPAQGRFLIDYGIDARRLGHISVVDLLRGPLDPALVRGKKVIVGAAAVELRDVFQVPRFGSLAGSAVQALAAESLLQGRALQPVGPGPSLVLTVLLLAAICAAGRRLGFGAVVALCAASAVGVELIGVGVQAVLPVVLVSAPTQAGLLALAVVATVQEITDRRVKLRSSTRDANRLRAMLDRVIADNFAGIVIVDQDGLVRATSAAAATILGTDFTSAVARPAAAVLPQPLAQCLGQAIAGLHGSRAGPPAACEIEVARPGKLPVLLHCVTTVSQIDDPARSRASAGSEFAICLTFKDVTEERQAQARLEETARTDALSGLANRSVYLAELEQRRSRQPIGCSAAILFDVDRFKLINDRLGHSSGDALIQAVARRLRLLLAPGDVAARLGGDEYALVVDRATPAEVQAFAEALRRGLGGVYEIGSYRPSVAISLGYVLLEGQGTTELMTSADAALYAAKAEGGDGVRLYDAAMKANAADAKELAQDLRVALERGEFEVFYQPQVDARSEHIVGVEALLRWHHPERGSISPARFIPIAERTGLIEAIGAWVLDTACREVATWPLALKLSVNLSAVQLARAGLADSILDVLALTGLPPARLDLELTESLLMENDGVVRATIRQLRDAGVSISLDDFGTGYSSLSYLNSFAIDKIKIDQSFVRGLVGSASAVSIISAVVDLAQALDLRVNVEGVEDLEQLRILQRLGCDEIQGYLFGKPQPPASIRASLGGHAAVPEPARARVASCA